MFRCKTVGLWLTGLALVLASAASENQDNKEVLAWASVATKKPTNTSCLLQRAALLSKDDQVEIDEDAAPGDHSGVTPLDSLLDEAFSNSTPIISLPVAVVLSSGASPSFGGGSAGQKSYTTPTGWTVSSDQSTYRNGNLYWLSNAIDGSEACKPSTCSNRDMRYGQVFNHYWLAAGRCDGSSWLEVQMDAATYLDHVELEPTYRSDSNLIHFVILADGTDVTPEGFDAKLAQYTAGTTWHGRKASGAPCSGMLQVDIKTVVRTIRLAELTQTGKYCGFGEVRLVGVA